MEMLKPSVYGLLAISVFFVGLTVTPDIKYKMLKLMLLLRDGFFVCMFAPVLPLSVTNSGNGGTISVNKLSFNLLAICVPSALRFKRKNAVNV